MPASLDDHEGFADDLPWIVRPRRSYLKPMTTFVLGAGKTGRRIARRLTDAGHAVRLGSRSTDVPFDLGDPATWDRALDGVTTAYLLEPSTEAMTTGEDRIPRFADAAVSAGVRRLVLLTAGGAGYEGHPLAAAEKAVRGSGAEWTILRPGWFSQNFSEAFWLPGILDGRLELPTGDGRTPFIDAEDIADVAFAALTEDRHNGEIYELTGPQAFGFTEAVSLIEAAIGRPVRYAGIDTDVFLERLLAAGIPEGSARLQTRIHTYIRDGRGELTDGVERALGRPPRRFEDYVTETAASGVWN